MNKFIWAPLRALLRKVPESTALLGLSVVTGLLCGLAAVALKISIHAIQGWLSGIMPGSRLPYLVLPGVGMLLSLLIVKYLVRDNIGHGVTKVLQAVSKNESKIKRHNIWSSLVTSALTIGFGGSVGAEAPIVYTGAAIGSNLGRYTGMSYRGMTLLLGCGAAGAVAGIFNAPLAGVLFTLEILLFNLSMSGILPLLLSSVSATLVSELCLGRVSPFAATIVDFNMGNVPFYLLLGMLCGIFSLYFIHTTLGMEDRLSRLKNSFLKWLVSSVALGLLIFLFPPLHGEGYNFLGPLLNGLDPEIGDGTPVVGVLNDFYKCRRGSGWYFRPYAFCGRPCGLCCGRCPQSRCPRSCPRGKLCACGYGGPDGGRDAGAAYGHLPHRRDFRRVSAAGTAYPYIGRSVWYNAYI